jgi:hypothetical protein
VAPASGSKKRISHTFAVTVLKGCRVHHAFIRTHAIDGGGLMNEQILRGALGGASLGSVLGGGIAWLVGILMLGLQPAIFLACGVYAGTVYGGIVGAVRAARHTPEPALARLRRTPR